MEETEGKESTLQQLEAASDEQETTSRAGVWKRFKQRLQRNTQDIKLVSIIRVLTSYGILAIAFTMHTE